MWESTLDLVKSTFSENRNNVELRKLNDFLSKSDDFEVVETEDEVFIIFSKKLLTYVACYDGTISFYKGKFNTLRLALTHFRKTD